MSQRKQKLNEKDYLETLKKMRLWEKSKRDLVALLVWDRNYWKNQADILERKKETLEQPDMFDRPAKEVEYKFQGTREPIPLGKKAYILIKSSGIGNTGMFCKIHEITKEQALDAANEWARENEKEELIC